VGTVYRAIDQRLGHTVAVKQIWRSEDSLRAAFEREAQLLAGLRHRALPKVTDTFIEPAGHFLVMEYVPGDDLSVQMLRQQEPLPVADLLRWADQLLDVLTYLHRQDPPVIHRDIKPHNLKLNHQGDIILLDFGLAKGMPRCATAERSIDGYTLSYASPEQLRGGSTDARSDLYGLGATLYDLLTAVKPVDARRRLAAVAAGGPDPLQPLHTLNPVVPSALADIVHLALALAPEDRFADAASMRLALHAAGGETTEVLALTESHRPGSPPNNLPAQLTSFVGREEEVAAVQQFLRSDDIRLVTLTGPGGIGKTRLALSVAARCLAHCRDGVFFVSLAPIREAHLVLPTVAQTLGLRDAFSTSILQNLQAHIQKKSMLLVLDNFEQVVAAAPLVSDLLTACPHLRILVTSREVLHVRGEQEFPLPALGVPDQTPLPPLDELIQIEAIKLFVQRAQAVKPGFGLSNTNAAAVVEICNQLEGLPLAIELAAAYCKFLSPQDILARLVDRLGFLRSGTRDLPDRQRTLRASIAWSYDLLSVDEQALFRRLSMMSGSFTLDAAEALCLRTGLVDMLVIEGIASLIDKSLLRPLESPETEPRFLMLQIIREFGLERLAAEGEEAAVRAAHAAYYYALVQEARSHLWGAMLTEWVARLNRELNNLRAALSTYLAQEDGAERALWMAGLLWRFWEIRGYISEGRTWLDRALERRAQVPLSQQWIALHGAGNLASVQAEYAVAKQHYQDSLHVLQSLLASAQDASERQQIQHGLANTFVNLGNLALVIGMGEEAALYTQEAFALHQQANSKIGLALATNNLARVKQWQGEYKEAERMSRESLDRYRELGDARGIGWNLERLGNLARECGDPEQAARFYAEAQTLFEDLTNQADLVFLYFDLGELARQQGEDEQAEAHYQASLKIAQELMNKREMANLFDRLAILACGGGRFAQAETLCDQSLSLHQDVGNLLGQSEALQTRGQIAQAQQQISLAAARYVESLKLRVQLGHRRGIADSLAAMAAIALEKASPRRAARLLAAADRLRQAMGIAIPLSARAAQAALCAAVRSALGGEAFAAAWVEGQTMSLDQAVVEAMAEE
jgi:predicted ATPase